MSVAQISNEEAMSQAPEALFKRAEASPGGLADTEARQRLEQFGPNELPEKKDNLVLKFLGYFWGPIPWMIEVAAVLSLVVKHWVDLIIILVMLVFNAVVGFWQEYQASNALAALKKSLALNARARARQRVAADPRAELVPATSSVCGPGTSFPRT